MNDLMNILEGNEEEEIVTTNKYGFVDIVKFVEGDQYLHQKLYPWQMLILKIFYMGTIGNEKLTISLTELEEVCENCVWNKNRLNMFKSPCISCTKFCPNARKSYFEKEIENTKITQKEYDHWEQTVKFKSNFISELQMIMQDLTPVERRVPADLAYAKAREIIEFYKHQQFDVEESEEIVKLIEDDKEFELTLEEMADLKISDSERVRDQILRKISKPFTDLVLVLGRRSGKSMLTSIIALYEAYRFIKMGNPQEFFGLLDDDLITILNVAGSEEQGIDAIFVKIKALATDSQFFKKYINTERTSSQSMLIWTPANLEKNKIRKEEGLPLLPGSIEIKSGTSKAATQVGKTCAVIIIDEVAEMIKKDDSKMSDSELYNKLKPSLASFGKFGKICVISNPLAKEGILWKLYNNSFRNDANPLMFQLPTELCNPSIEKEWLEAQRREDSEVFEMQYMARFSEGATEPLIPPVLIDLAFNQRRKRSLYGTPGINYFAHADPAFNSDNYAIAIVHVEERPIPDGNDYLKYVIVDHVEMWSPRNSREKVMIDEVDNYIIDLCKRKFNIVSLSYDQWQSISSIQKMQKNGIRALETRFTASYVEKIYETLVHLMQDERLEIYGSGVWVPEIKDQLLFLQKKYNRRGFKVQAAAGHYDDIPDAIAGATYMALQRAVFASLPRIRAARLGIDVAERAYMPNIAKRSGKFG